MPTVQVYVSEVQFGRLQKRALDSGSLNVSQFIRKMANDAALGEPKAEDPREAEFESWLRPLHTDAAVFIAGLVREGVDAGLLGQFINHLLHDYAASLSSDPESDIEDTRPTL